MRKTNSTNTNTTNSKTTNSKGDQTMRKTNSTNTNTTNSKTTNSKGDQTMRKTNSTNTNTTNSKGDQTMRKTNSISEKFVSLCAENAALTAKIEAKIAAIEAENAALKAMIDDDTATVPATVPANVPANVRLTQKGTVSKKPNRADRAYQTALSSKDWAQSLMSSPANDAAKEVYGAAKSHLKDVWKAIKSDKKIGASAYKIMQSVKDEKTLITLINACQKALLDMPKPDYGVIHCIIALCSPVIFSTCATSYSMVESWKVFSKERAGNAFWGSVCNNRIPSKCSDMARIIPLDRVCISVVRLSDCVTADNWRKYDTLVTAIKLLSCIDIER